MSVPAAMATKPAGTPPYLTPPNQLTRMIAKQTRPTIGVMNISSAGFMEMKVIETPASAPSSAAFGVMRADDRSEKAARHQHEALDEDPRQAGLPPLHGVPRGQLDRQHDDERDDEHVRHADPRGQRAHVRSTRLLRQPIGERRIVHGAHAHHHPRGRQDALEHQVGGHLQDVAKEAGERQQVDEDVGAEAEECVPVAGRPQDRAKCVHCHHTLLVKRTLPIEVPGMGGHREPPNASKVRHRTVAP